MLIRPVDTETQHDFINKERFGEIRGLAAEIATGLEHQLVDAGDKIITFKNRMIQATIRVGSRPRQLL